MNKIACLIATWFATPWAIVLVAVVAILAKIVGISDGPLTYFLSVLAISMSQFIMIAQDRDTRAMQAKLDGLVKVSDASNELVEAEKRL